MNEERLDTAHEVWERRRGQAEEPARWSEPRAGGDGAVAAAALAELGRVLRLVGTLPGDHALRP